MVSVDGLYPAIEMAGISPDLILKPVFFSLRFLISLCTVLILYCTFVLYYIQPIQPIQPEQPIQPIQPEQPIPL